MSRKDGFEIDGGWVAAAVCTALIFPVGLIMIWNKLKNDKQEKNRSKQLRRIGVSVIAAGLLMVALHISTLWGLLEILAGAALFSKAKGMDDLEKRRKRYLALIGARDRVSLREIARAIDQPVEQVRAELQEMIDKGWFGLHVYIDRDTMEIVLDGSMSRHSDYYEEVIYAEAVTRREEAVRTEEAAATAAAESAAQERANAAAQTAQASAASDLPDGVDENDEYGQWILSLRKVNDRIDDPVISEKIDRIEKLTGRIFSMVRSMPDKLPQIRKFMNYYLPTTLKLLESYALLEAQGIEGENISASKQKIEGIMDTLIQGFEKQLDLLFSAQAMDISSDVQVLESMMAADGLKDGQFTMKRTGTASAK